MINKITTIIKESVSIDREDRRVQKFVQSGRKMHDILNIVLANNLAKVGAILLIGFLLVALFGPLMVPNDPGERVVDEDGSWETNEPPSLQYPLGTNDSGFPIFAQVVVGTRIAFIVGLVTGLLVGGVGTTIGMIAGYYGGHIENAFMRIVDTAYGLPFIPFAIVVIIVLGQSLLSVIIAMSMIFWRSTARIIRSEVVSIKERGMISAAQASGASNTRILAFHILPVVLPIALLYSVFAIGWAIIAEAGLAFLGLGDPDSFSWGTILNEAHTSHALQQGLWVWIFAPGICIVLFVMTVYFIAQGIEELVNPELRTER